MRERRTVTVRQLNARKRYNLGDTYEPTDLNPFKRDAAAKESRAEAFKQRSQAGTNMSDQETLLYSDKQVCVPL